ncbi:hypothetical protein J3458_002127 [Metarhizium acridum]|uniref:uncharacterized protein n=1 Tax=Metarhizium acridum TaxID=92637 RepID=UPI001C6B2CEF|nr:hypothetical protein J3458_002127 [Metarhizium acridum]
MCHTIRKSQWLAGGEYSTIKAIIKNIQLAVIAHGTSAGKLLISRVSSRSAASITHALFAKQVTEAGNRANIQSRASWHIPTQILLESAEPFDKVFRQLSGLAT